MDQNQAIKDFLRDELDQFDWYLKCSIRNDNPRIANIIDYTFQTEGSISALFWFSWQQKHAERLHLPRFMVQ